MILPISSDSNLQQSEGMKWQRRLQNYFSDGKFSAAIIVKTTGPFKSNDEREEEGEVEERKTRGTSGGKTIERKGMREDSRR